MEKQDRDGWKQMVESYDKVLANEGLYDRFKARGAEFVGSVKGIKDRVSGTVQGMAAGARGDVAGVKAGEQLRQQGEVKGQVAKIESYRKTLDQKLEKFNAEVMKDLATLGINLKGVSPNSINSFKAAVKRGFDTLLTQVQTPAAPTAPAATTPTPPTTP